MTQSQYSDYKAASETIGRWLLKSTLHNDFTSATPISPKRPGDKFMITEMPPTQFASDYGLSIMHAPLDSNVIAAYEVIGTPASALPKYLELDRVNLGFGFGNENDLTASYLFTQDKTLSGWGVGYKKVIMGQGPYFYVSYRAEYSKSKRTNFYSGQSISNDLSCSLHFLLFDFYGGVRHTMGFIDFYSLSPILKLPRYNYFANLEELEYFYGMTTALSTKIRLTFQANKIGDDYSIAGKLSFHFHSLFPEFGSVLVDPRYLKR